MNPRARARLRELLGSPIEAARPIAGGSIAAAFEVQLGDGRRVFVKDYGAASPGVVEAEAAGLGWLAEAGAIAVARAIAWDTALPLLALEWIESGRPASDFDETLGRGLAALHRSGAPTFGLDRANFIGPLPQANDPATSWPEFYAESRLRPLLRRARDAGALSTGVVRAADAVLERLPSLCGEAEPPARLHGDLWRGNLMVDAAGRPTLVDPAVHGGHREMDLAMMRLFGGFSPRTFDAYGEHFPLADGASERVALCQLYPLLVHVVLFGGGYATDFASSLRRYR